jgi:hypothetical protein
MELRNVNADPQSSSARSRRDHDAAANDLPLFAFGGRTYVADLDARRLGAQLTRVIAAMSDGRWRTLSEIQAQIQTTTGKRDPEASLSARLRDIRKLWGEEAMESRRRVEDGVDGLWEYRSNAVLRSGE